MENNLKFEVIDLKDIWTEDEISNFWIDMYVAQRDFDLKKCDEPIFGKTVTLTLTKDHFIDWD